MGFKSILTVMSSVFLFNFLASSFTTNLFAYNPTPVQELPNQLLETKVGVTALEEVLIFGESMNRENESKNISVISQKDIQATQSKTLIDALRQIPGVSVSSYGNYQSSFVYIQGASPHSTLLLINGIKVTDSGQGSFDLGQIPLTAVERIEIIKTADAVAYGPNASGGVINIITKQAVGPTQAQANVEMGSHSSFYSDFGYLTQLKNGEYRISLFASNHTSEGYNLSSSDNQAGGDKDGFSKQSLLFNINYKNFEAYFQANQSNVELDPFASKRGFPYFYLADMRDYLSEKKSIYTYIKYNFTAGSFEQNISLSNYFSNRVEQEPLSNQGSSTVYRVYSLPDVRNYKANNLILSYNASKAILYNGFIKAGFDLESQYLSQKHAIKTVTPFTKPPATLTFGLNRTTFQEELASVYGIIGYKFIERINITAGTSANFNNNYKQQKYFNNNLGADYLGENYKLRTNFAISYKTPNLFELYDYESGGLTLSPKPNGVFDYQSNNNPLKQEKNQVWDIGFDVYSLNNRLITAVTYFQQQTSDLIQLNYDLTTGEPSRIFVNKAGVINTQGISLGNTFEINQYLSLGAGYTYLDVNRKVAKRPKHSLNAQIRLNINKFSLNSDYIYVGKTNDGFDVPLYHGITHRVGDWQVAAYNLVNLKAQYQFNPKFSSYIKIANLLNENYETAYGFQGDKLGVYIGVNWKS
ncbi:TonB-dependent receptor [Candidatus Hepatincolaceae symbiont of Richtersius coronifer]